MATDSFDRDDWGKILPVRNCLLRQVFMDEKVANKPKSDKCIVGNLASRGMNHCCDP